MYLPKNFQVEDVPTLHALMKRYSFATLVTSPGGASFASHLPFLIEEEGEPYGRLRGHMARANPQWEGFGEGREALAIFQGPHAYLSPSWYETELSVPTWNYAVVHAYGVPRVLEASDELYRVLRQTVDLHEAGFDAPWKLEELPEEYRRTMMRAIVGFEIPITRLEGKFKLSQNRSMPDQAGTITGLEATDDPMGRELARMMKERLGEG